MSVWLSDVLFRVMVVVGVMCAVIHWLFLRRLEERHHETWIELGSPTLILNNTISNARLTGKFLSRRKYRALGDKALSRLGDVEYALSWIGGAIFLMLVADTFIP
jgi:hypothetical protein